MRRLTIALALILLLPSIVLGVDPVGITQMGTINNGQQVSSSNASNVKTLTGATNRKVKLFSFVIRCSAGTSDVTIQDGSTTIWSTSTAFISNITTTFNWLVPLTSSSGNNLVITATSCGSGNTSTMSWQSELY